MQEAHAIISALVWNTKTMNALLENIKDHPRYQAGIQYGSPRRGHAEGTVAAHIAELERNLAILVEAGKVSAEQREKLEILIHVHDTFKGETASGGKKNCAIEDPQSHASLARAFLAQFTDDQDMLWITQYHDLGYAIYRNMQSTGKMNSHRLAGGLEKIADHDLYVLFCIIDSCTESKGREMIRWFVRQVAALSPALSVNEWIIDLLPEPVGVAPDVFCQSGL